MIRKLMFLPPVSLVIIGVVLTSAPGAQAFRASSASAFLAAPSQSIRTQASFTRHRARLVARVDARRAEARQDRRALERAADIAAAQAAAAAAQQAQQNAAQPSPSASQAPMGNVSTTGMAAFESCVINAESGGNPQAVNPSSGAGGLFQFLPSTWAGLGMGYPGGAQTAPVSVQEAAFAKLYAEAGTSPWAGDGCA